MEAATRERSEDMTIADLIGELREKLEAREVALTKVIDTWHQHSRECENPVSKSTWLLAAGELRTALSADTDREIGEGIIARFVEWLSNEYHIPGTTIIFWTKIIPQYFDRETKFTERPTIAKQRRC
jgi:hypothetical protein